MSGFTPGPWYFSESDEFGDTRFYVAQKEGAPYTPHYSDVATLIAETVSSEMVSIQRANAALISDAPALLDALTLCVAEFDKRAVLYRAMNNQDLDVPVHIAAARSLIAKHRGNV